MHRLGESPEKIAAELGLSRQEIELLLKVHRLVIASA
jgi:biotin operon repressor